LARKNSILNAKEFEERRVVLTSTPQAYFLQLAGPCNSNCVFCSRGHGYKYFDFGQFKEKIESKLSVQLSLAEQFILTGSGEYLQLDNQLLLSSSRKHCFLLDELEQKSLFLSLTGLWHF